MDRAYFRFYAELNDFLAPHRQQTRFGHRLKERASIKDTIEALGIPHTEVDLILVNGESVDFDYLVQDRDDISVYPFFSGLDVVSLSQVRPAPLEPMRFVLDVHLGKLATSLRLLGFDALYRNDYGDEELATISSQDNRMLLSQDRGLLKRKIVTYGYFVRASDSWEQVLEVLRRFRLFEAIAPFSRCLECNGELKTVPKAFVSDRIPPLTREYYDEFSLCLNCDRVYWKGGHYERMQQFVDRVREAANSLS